MNLDEIYSQFILSSPELDVQSLGWTDYYAQQKRFKILNEIGIEANDSILDVGCGYGDFSLLVGEKYLGIDVRLQAIQAAREKYKYRKFELGDIFGAKQHDWIVASGIFCFEYEQWEEDTLQIIKKMFELCHKGVAVNFLSSLNFEKVEGLKYVSPVHVIQNIILHISNNFTIKHNYGIDDFTIYLYK